MEVTYELAVDKIGFREYVCGSGRLGGKSQVIPKGSPVTLNGPAVRRALLVSSAGHYIWARPGDLVPQHSP